MSTPKRELRTDDIQGKIVHEYDGIEEADNELPKWWLAIFYLSTAFAIGYWFYYHEFAIGIGTQATYIEELAAKKAAQPQPAMVDFSALAQDSTAISAGKASFGLTCVPCHDKTAQGKIGPNLTDKYWIRGGSAVDIYKSISEGSPAKGMPGWLPSLGEQTVRNLTAFVLSIRNTNVKGKAPQGEEYTGE